MSATTQHQSAVRPYEPTVPRRAAGLLREFASAGVLTAADVHVAERLGALGGVRADDVLLAAALVVRSTAQGSVVVDLADVRDTWVVDDVEGEPSSDVGDPADLPWPDDGWAARVAASPLVGEGRPLRLEGTRLWLARYWQQEQQVAEELLARSTTAPDDVDLDLLRASLSRLFDAYADPDQRTGAAVCALSRVSVLAGGPGTGKTTTVSRLLAALREQHPDCRIALAAPTGKAAARLEEAVRSSSATLAQADRERLGELHAVTLHRLLGWRPGARNRFRHDRANRLPYEVVVVDESSMVSLTLMCRLLEALRPTTRLVLVGDPDQLASVEAGAVLGDLVDRTTTGRRTPVLAARLRAVLPGIEVEEQPVSPGATARDGVTALRTNHRTDVPAIAQLADYVQAGDADGALELLRSGADGVELIEVADDARPRPAELAGVRADVQRSGDALHEAARRGDGAAAVRALDAHRLLCGHRLGPRGVAHWSALSAQWLAERHQVLVRPDGHHVGEPLLVTTNDYEIGLYNGDTGVIVDDGRGGLVAAFGRGGAPVLVPVARLGDVRSLHALTVHRSQGSQFTRVTVVLPPATSHLGTRETVYTAVSRATQHVRLIGSAVALAAAISRPAARATGLKERLG
jgi:exodeoxyribonuclease V alpha subunit